MVYTVYIPMTDAGGGPDWSIQYAILDPASSRGALLTPPVAAKKVRPLPADIPHNPVPATIFFSGSISAAGELTAKPINPTDPQARQVLDALSQWQFLPARLNGVAVAVKVLIGAASSAR